MNTKPSIKLFRDDNQKGVSFDSPQTLQRYLAFVRKSQDPSTCYFIPVLENEGVIPEDNPDFEKLLRRMGVLPGDIPNSMRGHFMVAFRQGGEKMLAYSPWATMTDDERQDLIQYLKVLCEQSRVPSTMLSFVRDVCLRVLVEGEGHIYEDMTFVQVAESRGYRISQIGTTIGKYHQEMKSWLDTKTAAQRMRRSVRHVQRLAQRGIPHLEAIRNQRGDWTINPVSVDDWLIRNKQVRIS